MNSEYPLRQMNSEYPILADEKGQKFAYDVICVYLQTKHGNAWFYAHSKNIYFLFQRNWVYWWRSKYIISIVCFCEDIVLCEMSILSLDFFIIGDLGV